MSGQVPVGRYQPAAPSTYSAKWDLAEPDSFHSGRNKLQTSYTVAVTEDGRLIFHFKNRASRPSVHGIVTTLDSQPSKHAHVSFCGHPCFRDACTHADIVYLICGAVGKYNEVVGESRVTPSDVIQISTRRSDCCTNLVKQLGTLILIVLVTVPLEKSMI